ncbi:MAG TPA: carboxypeptidase-like regulatory domain-containing protein [Bryobacteraceae bacterium]|nr:carboxypeptidase-like regulatory domain-containing protein [Bryobacteraceae bacterium]
MRFWISALCVCALAAVTLAQSDRGTITGTVSDPAGAVVANAAIQTKNVETGALYQAASTTTGNYTLTQLPAGTHELSVAVQGFKKYVRQGLTIQIAQVARIDIGLEVGFNTESVTEAAPLLQYRKWRAQPQRQLADAGRTSGAGRRREFRRDPGRSQPKCGAGDDSGHVLGAE